MELVEGKDLIIGRGEIGSALQRVLSKVHDVSSYDITDGTKPKMDVRYLHIAIPFKHRGKFIQTVNNYVYQYEPRITVIHSTVGVGTTELIAAVSAVHSPVIGVHRKPDDPPERPSMDECLLTFEKWVAGKGADEIADYFRQAGMKSKSFPNLPRLTEVGKLLDTTQYGLMIAFAQEMERFCNLVGVPFETAVMAWTGNYNKGYSELGMNHVRRPVLYPGVIGGHCVMPNIDLLMRTKVPKYNDPGSEKRFEWKFLGDVKMLNDIKKSNKLRSRNKHKHNDYRGHQKRNS